MLSPEEKRERFRKYQKEYYSRPEIKQKQKEYNSKYHKREDVILKQKERVSEYQNKPKTIENKALRDTKIKIEVFNKLGGVICKKCGITDIRLLTINHLNGKPSHSSDCGRQLYYEVYFGRRKIDDLEVLCMNCNILYEYARGNRNSDILEHPEIKRIYLYIPIDKK